MLLESEGFLNKNLLTFSFILKIFKLLRWPIRKLANYTKPINTLLEAPNKISISYFTKVTGVTCRAAGAAKGSVDALEALEALACQDVICFVVSCIRVGADGLDII